jgi:hypothetical protein
MGFGLKRRLKMGFGNYFSKLPLVFKTPANIGIFGNQNGAKFSWKLTISIVTK